MKTACVTDEIECFFHVLIYYAVRFLQHNLPDRSVGQFFNNYFDLSSGHTQVDELTAPELKRRMMDMGEIPLDFCGVRTSLQLMWVNVPPKAPNVPKSSLPALPPNYNHPLNDLISTLLSWFRALYALERMNRAVLPDPSQHCLDGEVAFRFDDDDEEAEEPASYITTPKAPSPEELANLQALAANVNHSTVLKLFKQACRKTYPSDKGEDRRPEKVYTLC